MRIGLISDTHGYYDAWNSALAIFGNADLILHAGDVLSSGPKNPRYETYDPTALMTAINDTNIPIIFAQGNCDAEIDAMFLNYPMEAPYAHVYVNGMSIVLTHGHLKEEDALVEMGRRLKVDIIVRGHSHVRAIQQYDSLVMVNPGSASLPLNEDKKRSVGLIEGTTISVIGLDDKSVIESIDIKV